MLSQGRIWIPKTKTFQEKSKRLVYGRIWAKRFVKELLISFKDSVSKPYTLSAAIKIS